MTLQKITVEQPLSMSESTLSDDYFCKESERSGEKNKGRRHSLRFLFDGCISSQTPRVKVTLVFIVRYNNECSGSFSRTGNPKL